MREGESSSRFSPRLAGHTGVFALRTVTPATLAADHFVRVTDRATAGFAHGERRLVASCAVALIDPGQIHFAPAFGLHIQSHRCSLPVCLASSTESHSRNLRYGSP